MAELKQKGFGAMEPDNSSMEESMKDKQQKGPKGGKMSPQESGSPGRNDLAQRGMSSDEAAKLFKSSGQKVLK